MSTVLISLAPAASSGMKSRRILRLASPPSFSSSRISVPGLSCRLIRACEMGLFFRVSIAILFDDSMAINLDRTLPRNGRKRRQIAASPLFGENPMKGSRYRAIRDSCRRSLCLSPLPPILRAEKQWQIRTMKNCR